jgi:hypothetical protein
VVTSAAQRRIARSRQKERDSGKWLLENDGPDPKWEHIASSTGRTGQINDLQMDVVSKHYAGEVKNIRMSLKLLRFWDKIIKVSAKHGKVPVMIIYPSNPLITANYGLFSQNRIPAWHIITAERHAELLRHERYASKASYILESLPTDMDDMLEGYEEDT